MSSIFTKLFKWRPREGRSPQEDYLTETFAGVLEREPGLDVAIATRLIGHKVASVVLETQKVDVSYDRNNRFDLWMDAREVMAHDT